MFGHNPVGKTHFKEVFLKIMFYIFHSTIQDLFPFIDQHNMITDFLNLFHPVRTEDNRGPVAGQVIDLVFDEVCIHGVESTERLIQNDQFGFMEHSSYKLQFLAHTF